MEDKSKAIELLEAKNAALEAQLAQVRKMMADLLLYAPGHLPAASVKQAKKDGTYAPSDEKDKP